MIESRAPLASLRRARREGAIDLLFLLPILVVLAGFLFYPLVYGIVLSLHDTKGFDLTKFVGFDHYAHAIFGDAVFHQALVAVGAVWKFLYAPFFGILPTVGSAIGLDTQTIAPLADPHTALWAIMIAFLWRFSGFSMVVYLAAIQSLPHEYYEHAVLEGAGGFQRFRHITWPLLWPQTFTLVLLTTLGTLRIFDMMWVMTEGGPSHATETVATDVYVTAFRFLQVGYAQAMAMVLLIVILLLTVVEYRLLNRRAEMVSS